MGLALVRHAAVEQRLAVADHLEIDRAGSFGKFFGVDADVGDEVGVGAGKVVDNLRGSMGSDAAGVGDAVQGQRVSGDACVLLDGSPAGGGAGPVQTT